MRRSWWWTRRRAFVAASLGLIGIPWVLSVQATTRQGVNFQVSSLQIPLYVKAIDFLHRHYQYQLLASNITRGLKTDRERVLAIFDWTRQHVRPTPRGWPVIDDHILHIIIRGHGVDEQMADVFTTLSTYTGVRAFWKRLQPSEDGGWLVLSFVQVDGRWLLFDVWRNLVFANAQGDFLSASELAANPQLAAPLVGNLTIESLPYLGYFATPAFEEVPRTLRAELQMPWPRLAYEVGRALRLVPDANAMVPPPAGSADRRMGPPHPRLQRDGL